MFGRHCCFSIIFGSEISFVRLVQEIWTPTFMDFLCIWCSSHINFLACKILFGFVPECLVLWEASCFLNDIALKNKDAMRKPAYWYFSIASYIRDLLMRNISTYILETLLLLSIPGSWGFQDLSRSDSNSSRGVQRLKVGPTLKPQISCNLPQQVMPY